MSARRTLIKKIHRDVRRAKNKIIDQIAREILTLPLKERLKMAWRIVWKG